MTNLTPIFLIAGIGVLSIVIEKILSQAGGERHSYLIGITSFIVGFGVILYLLKGLINEIMTTFFNGGM